MDAGDEASGGREDRPKKAMPQGSGAPGIPKPTRLHIDMRLVYRGKVKAGQPNLTTAQEALLNQFATKTSEFLKDLRALDKELADRQASARELAKGKTEKPKAEIGKLSAGMREMCERLIEEASSA